MDVYAKIAQIIKAMGTAKGAILFPAEVKSVDGDTCTIKIGTLELTDVRLRAVVNKKSDKIVVTPQKGSKVLVADLSGGDYRDLAVLSYSEPEKVELFIENTTVVIDKERVVINGGQWDGLIKIQQLTNKLNELVAWCGSHQHGGVITAVSGGVNAPAAGTTGDSAAPTTQPAVFNKDDYEDAKITH